MQPLAFLCCDSGWSQNLPIGQGHLFRCRSFAAHLQPFGWQIAILELRLREADESCGSRYDSLYAKTKSESPATKGRLGWQNAAAASGSDSGQEWQEYYQAFNIEQLRQLQKLPCSDALQRQFARNPDLLVIDSYQLPYAFYQSCARLFPQSRLLALDDFERQDYPQNFWVLQAAPRATSSALPKAKQHNRYLCGLRYQVLRPEFTAEEGKLPLLALPAFRLVVPGSAFSLQQVQKMAAVLYHHGNREFTDAENPAHGPRPWLVVLSPRQSNGLANTASRTEIQVSSISDLKLLLPTKIQVYLSNLTALDLRQLYIQAEQIFCSASQSLLEVFALLPFARRFAVQRQRPAPQCCALLSADNQLGILQSLETTMAKQGKELLQIDLRHAIQAAVQTGHDTNIEEAFAQSLPKLTQAGQANRAAALSTTIPTDDLTQLGDGQAIRRILQKLKLG